MSQPYGISADGDIYDIHCASAEYGPHVIQEILAGAHGYLDSAGHEMYAVGSPEVSFADCCPNCMRSLLICGCDTTPFLAIIQ